jgi:hypothetical protein
MDSLAPKDPENQHRDGLETRTHLLLDQPCTATDGYPANHTAPFSPAFEHPSDINTGAPGHCYLALCMFKSNCLYPAQRQRKHCFNSILNFRSQNRYVVIRTLPPRPTQPQTFEPGDVGPAYDEICVPRPPLTIIWAGTFTRRSSQLLHYLKKKTA